MDKSNHKLRTLLILWQGKRGDRRMPSRADLEVQTLKPWLGNLALIDIAENGDTAFRLCGTNLLKRFDGDTTGKSVDALPADVGQRLALAIAEVRQTPHPVVLTHERMIEGVRAEFMEVCAPLSDDAEHVRTILFASYQVNPQ